MKGDWTSMIETGWRDQYALRTVKIKEVTFDNFDGSGGLDIPRDVWDALGQPRYLIVGDHPGLIEL